MQLPNHAERLIANTKSEWYLIGLKNVFVSVMVEIFGYKSVYHGYIV